MALYNRHNMPWLASWAIMLVFSALFNLIFLVELSPLYSTYHFNDGGCFWVIAKGWVDGYIPYRDYFDHKGPLFYLFYVLAYLISGTSKWGAFVLWSVLLSLVLMMLRGICRAIGARTSVYYMTLFAFLAYYTAFGYAESYGTEIISIPLQVLPIWILTRCLKLHDGRHRYTDVLLYGVTFGSLMMIRPNNACVNCAVVITCATLYIKKGWYRGLIQCMITFIAGMAAVILPFVVYYRVHGALDDMLYCYLRFNMMYKGDGDTAMLCAFGNSTRVIPVLLLSVYGFWVSHKTFAGYWLGLTMAMSSAIIAVVYIFGANFAHYFMILAPVASVTLMLIAQYGYMSSIRLSAAVVSYVIVLRLCDMVGIGWYMTIFILFIAALCVLTLPNKKYAYIGVSIILMTPLFDHLIMSYPSSMTDTITYDKARIRVCDDISRTVPYADRDSVYCDEAFLYKHYFQYADSRPVNKYFNLPQSVLVQTDPTLADKIGQDFIDKAPKWVFTSDAPTDILTGHLKDDYTLSTIIKPSGFIKPLYIYQRNSH